MFKYINYNAMKKIPTTVHAYIDYGSALIFLVSPWLFKFSDVPTAKWLSIFVGVMILVMSLLTRYEYGVVRLIPMRIHLMTDILLGLFLIISPWLLGFYGETFLFHIVMGFSALGAGMWTKGYVKKEALIVENS